MTLISSPLNDSTILITGGTGSWGVELTRQLLAWHHPRALRIYSRGEQRQVEMKRHFQNASLDFWIGDVRDKDRLALATSGCDYIFHLAALKHVPVCEDNPWEAVLTNIVGTQNVVDCAIRARVKKVVDISTDKAVDPFNLYGVTKACGEKLVIAANRLSSHTAFVCIRGGNVIGTNGSVVPLFMEQLRRNNELTLTHPQMTRFVMRVQDAVTLLIHAAVAAVGGEVIVMKMPAVRIERLAAVIIAAVGNEASRVRVTGIRPGEKLYEVLVSRYEVARTRVLANYFVVLPQINLPSTEQHYESLALEEFRLPEYSSETTVSLPASEMHALLEKDGWFRPDFDSQALNYLRTLSPEDLAHFIESEGWGLKSRPATEF